MQQSWDMGQILSLPLPRKACWGLFGHPKKSNGFGRVRTRVPEASMLTTRPPKPLRFDVTRQWSNSVTGPNPIPQNTTVGTPNFVYSRALVNYTRLWYKCGMIHTLKGYLRYSIDIQAMRNTEGEGCSGIVSMVMNCRMPWKAVLSKAQLSWLMDKL